MRHLWSLLAGAVVAPLTWFLLATGQHRAQATVDDWTLSGSVDTAQLVAPAILVAVAGVLLGLLGTLRWSPLGPVVAGLLLLVPPVLMFVDPAAVHDALPAESRVLGQQLSWRAPVDDGTLLLLGALLLMAVFSVRRWRRWPVVAAPAATATTTAMATTPPAGEAVDRAAAEHPETPEATATPDVPWQPSGEQEATAGPDAPADDEPAAATGDGGPETPADRPRRG